jgi:hypothetical protein
MSDNRVDISDVVVIRAHSSTNNSWVEIFMSVPEDKNKGVVMEWHPTGRKEQAGPLVRVLTPDAADESVYSHSELRTFAAVVGKVTYNI